MDQSTLLSCQSEHIQTTVDNQTQLARLPLSSLLLTRPASTGIPWRIAVIGAGTSSERLLARLQRLSPRRIELLGLFDQRGNHRSGRSNGAGSLSQLLDAGRRQRIDRVLIALPEATPQRLYRIADQLAPVSNMLVQCDCVVATAAIGVLAPIEDIQVHVLERPALPRRKEGLKRTLDLMLGGLLTLAALPLMALLALWVKLDSPGPILFRQRRHGLDNREFEILKFRSMRWNAAAAPLRQTTRADARITSSGRFLRRSSLDELPQLFNVLRGDMSLVGPRPHALDMRTEGRLCADIVPAYPQRHRMRPGLTGWAQVRGLRGATERAAQLRRRIEHDLAYIENWSLWLDVRIMAMTPGTLMRGKNAY